MYAKSIPIIILNIIPNIHAQIPVFVLFEKI